MLKSFQKSIQNVVKIIPNRGQNDTKSKSGGSLGLLCGVSSHQGASWTPLGQLLGGSWRILGASWVAPGPAWRSLGEVLGKSWGSLGEVLGEI